MASDVNGMAVRHLLGVDVRAHEKEGKMTREEAGLGNEYFSVDEDGIHIKAGMPSGANGGASPVVIDDSTSHITICGGAGEQVKSIVKALRGLADALATLTE